MASDKGKEDDPRNQVVPPSEDKKEINLDLSKDKLKPRILECDKDTEQGTIGGYA